MTCEELTDVLQAYLDGEISPEEQAQVVEHLKTCAPCQAILAGYRWVVHAAQQLKQGPKGSKSPSKDTMVPEPGQAPESEGLDIDRQ